MKLEFEGLSKSYDSLHHKSQEIIRTLQKERDEKIIECEELKSQVWMCNYKASGQKRGPGDTQSLLYYYYIIALIIIFTHEIR